MNSKPPTFTSPLLLNRSEQFIFSLSFGSGVCSQSSFSTSSGNSSRPAEGRMLYFSLTVCVFTPSSSLPALDGARESSNGDAKGPYRLSLLPSDPDDHDVLLLLKPLTDAGDRNGLSSSRNLLLLLFRGGSNSSAESAGVWLEYRPLLLAWVRNWDEGAVPGRAAPFCGINDREEFWREVCGRCCWWALFCCICRRSSLPELRRMCGGACRGGGEEVSESISGCRQDGRWKGGGGGEENWGGWNAQACAARLEGCVRSCVVVSDQPATAEGEEVRGVRPTWEWEVFRVGQQLSTN